MNYNEFTDIAIEDTKLLKKTDYVYNFFINNGINSLKELFYYDDNRMINYNVSKKDSVEIKGFIRLLRYQYLSEELNIESILKKKLNSAGLEFDIHIRSMGFNEEETKYILEGIDFNARNNIMDLLKIAYYKKEKSTTFKKKLALIINSTNKKEKKTTYDYRIQLEKLRLEIKSLKESKVDNTKKR